MSYFLKEVEEQPQSMQRLIDSIPSIKKDLLKTGLEFPKIAFFGMGSSLYAGISAAYFFRLFGVDANFFDASEVGQYAGAEWFENFDILVFISHSGETSEVKSVLDKIKNPDILKVAITTNSESYIAKNSDILIETLSGEEKSIGATKSYANSVLAAFIFGLVMTDRPESEFENIRIFPGRMNESINKAHKAAERFLNGGFDTNFDNSVMTSTGFALSAVYQSVLTLNAIASANILPISAGMLQHHGPEELFLKEHGLIEFIPNTVNAKTLLEIHNSLSKKSKFSWVISSDSINVPSYDRTVIVEKINSKVPEYLQSLLFLPYIQILSHKITTLNEERE